MAHLSRGGWAEAAAAAGVCATQCLLAAPCLALQERRGFNGDALWPFASPWVPPVQLSGRVSKPKPAVCCGPAKIIGSRTSADQTAPGSGCC